MHSDNNQSGTQQDHDPTYDKGILENPMLFMIRAKPETCKGLQEMS